jgi:hypothetical protein
LQPTGYQVRGKSNILSLMGKGPCISHFPCKFICLQLCARG